jgi:hypothetical protein
MNFRPVCQHSACSNSAGRGSLLVWPSPWSERPARSAVKAACEAGRTAPDCGQGGVVVLASGWQQGRPTGMAKEGEWLGRGGSPKWGTGVELRRTGHRCAGTPARRGRAAPEHSGTRRWLPYGEAQGGTGTWTWLIAVAPHGW